MDEILSGALGRGEHLRDFFCYGYLVLFLPPLGRERCQTAFEKNAGLEHLP